MTRPEMCEYLIEHGFTSHQLWSFQSDTLSSMVRDLQEDDEEEM
jgi:hypothetical protein